MITRNPFPNIGNLKLLLSADGSCSDTKYNVDSGMTAVIGRKIHVGNRL